MLPLENSLESLIKRSSFSDHHQNPKQDDPFFSNFPSLFLDEHELIMPLNQALPHHHHNETCSLQSGLIKDDTHSAKTEPAKRALNPASPLKLKEKATEDCDHDHQPLLKRRNLGKRAGKKDWHSKIRTAQGIRDRRMRLSLQIARKFFDLQDMLGYDKASNTIEWLFSKSKKAIKELMMKEANLTNTNLNNFSISDGKSESFLSECEVMSGVEVSSINEVIIKELGQKPRKMAPKLKNNNFTRESREKARARARWRTREKVMTKLGFDQINSRGLINFCSPNYCPNDQKLGFCNDQLGVVDQDAGTIEKLLGNSRLSSSASNNFPPVSENNNNNNNYYYDNYQSYIDPSSKFMGFLGNLELLSNGTQFTHVTNQDSSMAAGNYVINPSSVYSAPNYPLFNQ